MESKAKILGHPVHQVLIVFPLGLLGTAVVFDIIHLCSGTATTAVVAYWLMAAGIIGGLVAAPSGWIDWFAIPSRTRAKSVGLMHGITSVIVVVLFIISWSLRSSSGEIPGRAAYVLSFVATVPLVLMPLARSAFAAGALAGSVSAAAAPDLRLDPSTPDKE